ncbi:FmdB family zinc ribbon protein [Pseudomarimonas arenosa]|uniref:Zinc ribbon domain-containing protein n=1 Tax=Pseudomarimonas arenosa TaxID=2774145 RepID=A0AAW3ZPJ1_9GAMM|nr:zinc ribbon domain-containing protein [Pseudomarimonas arenosa]MBD8526537.1 zinc ribbon domain-containing protein [Pseudomarimonas arenosa]
MPIYRYQANHAGCPHCQPGFDEMQRLSDPELSACPQCGAAIRRVICAPALAIGGSHLLSEKKIGEKGFTQYKKIGKGVYEKTAGKGPDIISSD